MITFYYMQTDCDPAFQDPAYIWDMASVSNLVFINTKWFDPSLLFEAKLVFRIRLLF